MTTKRPSRPRTIGHLVADDTRDHYLAVDDRGRWTWTTERSEALKLDEASARRLRDTVRGGYAIIPEVCHG